jgi:putative photosynthetic complex assembly protein
VKTAEHAAEVENIHVPTGALVGAGLLIAATFALALIARLTGADTAAPTLPAVTAAVATRDVTFEPETAEGRVVVRDALSGTVIQDYPAGQGGFVRGALRGLEHMRTRRGLSLEGAYRVAEWPGGRVTLQDRLTGMIVEVNAFGQSSVAGYRALLPSATPTGTP